MAADMQPVPAEVAEDLADEPFQFAWSSMDGFWG
jgi:hypothetical protein